MIKISSYILFCFTIITKVDKDRKITLILWLTNEPRGMLNDLFKLSKSVPSKSAYFPPHCTAFPFMGWMVSTLKYRFVT
jgi:hypothetical protein